jgi:hypothetical protein
MKWIIFLVTTIFATCSSLANAQASFAPGRLYAGPVINVRAPNSEGWKLVSSSANGMVFGKRGTSANESYIAQVSFFGLPPTTNREEFIAVIKTAIERDSSAERFKTIKADYDYTDERGYPCVRFNALTEDTKAKTSFFKRETLKLQIDSLYCRHPRKPESGFAIIFSRRGATIDEALNSEAESFIAGVQVPAQ